MVEATTIPSGKMEIRLIYNLQNVQLVYSASWGGSTLGNGGESAPFVMDNCKAAGWIHTDKAMVGMEREIASSYPDIATEVGLGQ